MINAKGAALSLPARPDLRALTGLRGIAAWLVVFYHIRSGMAGYLPAPVIDFLAKGYLAVDFFFLLSGFVIWLSYAERFQQKGFGYSFAFYWRRIARIWPLHIFILICTIAYVGVLVLTDRNSDGYPISELPLHIFLLQNWGFTDALSWNHPAWSISTEIAAYLIFPLIAIGLRWERYKPVLLIGLVAVLAGVLHLYFAQLDYATLGDDIPKTGLFRCLMQFTAGTIICVLWRHWRTNRSIAFISGAAAIILLSAWLAGFVPETLVIPVGFASALLSMAIFAEHPKNPLSGRVIHYFGEISYATYLVHFMLFIAFKTLFVSDPANIPPLLIAFYVALTFAVSAALYHLVERTGQRLVLSAEPKFISPHRKPDKVSPHRS